MRRGSKVIELINDEEGMNAGLDFSEKLDGVVVHHNWNKRVGWKSLRNQ